MGSCSDGFTASDARGRIMALTTYDELKASIAEFLNRDDLTSIIPDFVTLAETQLNRDLRHWRMEDRALALCDTQYTALPNNFIEPVRITLPADRTYTLELVGPYELSKLRMDNQDTVGRPQFYAVVDGAFEVFPTPDSDYTIELVYYESIPHMSASLQKNWVLEYFPDAVLYGSLLHSAPYLQEDQRVQTWGALYQAAVSAINLEGERARSSGSGRRIKIRSYG